MYHRIGMYYRKERRGFMSTYMVPNLIATNSFFKSEEYLSPNSAIGEGIVGSIGIGVGTAIVDKAIVL